MIAQSFYATEIYLAMRKLNFEDGKVEDESKGVNVDDTEVTKQICNTFTCVRSGLASRTGPSLALPAPDISAETMQALTLYTLQRWR